MQVQENQFRAYKEIGGLLKFKADIQQSAEQEHWENGLTNYRYLAVPASWNDQAEELEGFFGTGWYETEVWVPKEWEGRKLKLRFEGVSIGCKVFWDGKLLGAHRGIGLPFEFELITVGDFNQFHRLSIAVDGSLNPWDLPPARLDDGIENEGVFHFYPAVSYDYYPYAGIHRSIYVYAVQKTHLEDVRIDTELDHLPETKCKINCRLTFSKLLDGKVKLTLFDSEQKKVGCWEREICKGFGLEFTQQIELEQTKLWDIGMPNLYEMQIDLYENGVQTDVYQQHFGIRKVEVKNARLLLNGKECFLKGFGKHEDFCLSGKGFQATVMVKDYELLKWIGANSYRTSHYPYDQAYLDYADRQGILVIAETPFVGLNQRMYREDIAQRACAVIQEMIARDYNHPSIIMWSLANEPVVTTQDGKIFFQKMAQTARACDPARPIMYAAHMEPEDNLGAEFYDVLGINKYFGWYDQPGEIEKGTEQLINCLEHFYQIFDKPILLTEFGADAVAGMHSMPAKMFSEEYQSELLSRQYLAVKEKPYCIGTHIWSFADFKAPQAITRVMGNHKGVFTRTREPKLAAHTIRNLWKNCE